MPTFQLITNEKSLLLRENNYITLQLASYLEDTSKIKLQQKFQKLGIKVLDVKVVNLPKKFKKRGRKQNIITIKRAKKFLVKLLPAEKFDEEKLKQLNELN